MSRNEMSRWNRGGWPQGGRDPFTDLMENFFGRGEDLSNRAWRPAVDIRETEDAYELHAELPGMKKDDIGITLENNVLKLSGERRFEKDVKEEEFHRIERSYGSFTRAFSLPSRVDSERVEASFEDGVLKVRVPKAAETRPRRIEIG